MLSPVEAAAFARGQVLKRFVRAAAAMNDLYDDVAISEAVGVSRGSVGKWWVGAKPQTPVVFRLAAATGLSAEELVRYLNADGPPPHLPQPLEEEAEARAQAAERSLRARPTDEVSEEPPAPHEKAGSGGR